MADPVLSDTLSKIPGMLLKESMDVSNFVASAFARGIQSFWLEYGSYIIIFALIFFVIKFFERGIGSVVYNLIFFSIIGVVIFVKGWEIIFNNSFELITLFAYIASFKLTHFLLVRAKVWSR